MKLNAIHGERLSEKNKVFFRGGEEGRFFLLIGFWWAEWKNINYV